MRNRRFWFRCRPKPHRGTGALRASGDADDDRRYQRFTLEDSAELAGRASDVAVDYSGASVASITFAATATDLPTENMSPAVLNPGASAQHLYVGNWGSDSVSVFDLADPATPPSTFTGGDLRLPTGMAFDATGKLYVAD